MSAIPDIQTLTDDEITRLVLSAVAFRPDRGATREEIDQVLTFATNALADLAMVRMALDGLTVLGVDDDGEIAMRKQ